MKVLIFDAVFVATGLVLAAPAHGDADTDFSNQLHTYGIYGQRGYSAWVGKITCKRLSTGVDGDANESAEFDGTDLQRGTTTVQVWRFLGAAINTYCPNQIEILRHIGEEQ